MLELDLTTVAFEIVNFILLTALLYRFLFQRVMRNVRARAAKKDQLLTEMEQDRQKAAQMKTEWQTRLANAEEEAAAVMARAQRQAEADRGLVIQQTQTEVEHILAEAHCDGYRLRQHAVDAFHNDLVNTILDISGQVVIRTAPPELHHSLVQQLVDHVWHMGHEDVEQVETIRRALQGRLPTAMVTTAQSLSAEQQNRLRDTLTALVDQEVNLEFQTDPTLIAGVRVRLGDTVIENAILDRVIELRKDVSTMLQDRLIQEAMPASSHRPDFMQEPV